MATRRRSSRYDRGKGQEEAVRTLLTQIVAHAERQRVTKQVASDRASRFTPGRDEPPLSLIELIQASGAVFERYGIGAPDDAVYHRYLLSLSIDPEPDWRTKLAGFRLADQPRVRRLCAIESAVSAQLGSHGTRASLSTAALTHDKLTASIRHDMHRVDSAREQRRPSRDSIKPRVDMFGDVLSRRDSFRSNRVHTKERSPGGSIRQVSPTWRSSPRVDEASTRSRSSDDEGAVAPSPFARQFSVDHLLTLQSSAARPASSTSTRSRRLHGDKADDLDASDPRSKRSDSSRRAAEFESAVSDAQLLSTVFEKWKSTRHLRKLVEMRTDQDVRMRRALMPTGAAAAIFRWIVRSLPEKYAVAGHAVSRELFIPAALARRINVTQKSSVSNLSALNKFARRVLLSRVKDIIAVWSRRAVATVKLRRKCLARQRSEALETAFQCILQWRLFAETRKCLVERANWISLRCGRRLLRETISRWRLLWHEREREASASEGYALKRAMYCWGKWRRLVQEHRHIRGVQAGLASRRAITRWRLYTRVQGFAHDQLLAADGHFRSLLLAHGWGHLKKHLITAQTRRFKVDWGREARSRRCKRAVLRGWRQVLETKYQTDELLAKFVKWRRLRLLRRWLAAWTDWVDTRLAVAEKLEGAAQLRRSRLLTVVIHGWQLHHESAMRLNSHRVEQIRASARRRIWRRWRRLAAVRLVVLTLRRDYTRHVLNEHLSRWRAFSNSASLLRLALSAAHRHRECHLLARCWRALVLHMEGQRSKKQAALRFLQHRRVTSEHAAFHQWSAVLNLARSRRTQANHVRVAIRQASLMRRVWFVWRKGFRLARLGQLAAKNLDSYRKAHVFRVWKHVVGRKKDDRNLCAHAVQRMGLSRTASSFYRWKMHALKMRRTRESVRVVTRLSCENCARRCWMIWCAAHSKTQKQKQQMVSVMNKWKSQRMHASFLCWKTRWSLRKRHRHVLQKAQLLSTERVMEIHFQAWTKSWKLRAKAKIDLASATTHLERWKLVRVLQRWREKLAVTRVKGGQLREALAHWQHLGLAAPFRRWVAFTKTCKLQKTQLAVVATFSHRGLVRTHFSNWKTWTRRSKQAANRLSNAQLHIQSLRMRRCLGALRSNARKRRHFRRICAQIARSSACGALQQSLAVWKRFVAARHALLDQQAGRSEAIERYRLRVCLRRWEKKTRVRRLVQSTMLKAAHLSKSTLLQQCFQSWREYAKHRTLRHALKQKALVFQVFSLLPVYFRGWRRFVDQQKRTRSLLLRASGFMSHQLEHKAFAAWVVYAKTKKKSLQVIARWQQATASRCFTAWTRFAGRQRTLRSTHELAARTFAKRKTRCALRQWHQTARTRRILRVLSSQQVERATAEVLACWRRFVHRHRAARLLVGRIHNQTLARVFNSWKQRASLEVERRQSIRDRFAALWLADLRAKCWSRWRRYARTRSFMRVLLQGKQSELSREIMTRWWCETRRRKRCKQCAVVVQSAAATQVKREFWGEWRVRLKILTCARVMQGQMVHRRSSESVRWRFGRWLTFTRVHRRVHEQQRRVELRLMRVVLRDGFSAFARAKAQQRALSVQIQDMHRAFLRVWLVEEVQDRITRVSASEQMVREGAWRRSLSQTWRVWLAYHVQKQATRARSEDLRRQLAGLGGSRVYRAQTAMARWYRLDLARALRHLHIQVHARRQKRRNALVAMEWWLSTTCTRVFHGWKCVYVWQKKTRVVQALYVRGATRRMFVAWSAWLQRRHKKKSRDAKAHARYIASLNRVIFAGWKTFSVRRRRHKQLVLSAYRASCVRFLGALMLEWKTFTVGSRMKRVQSTVARVFRHERLLRKSVSEWKERVRLVKALRYQLQANTERLQVLMLCSCFRAWRVWSKQSRKLSRIMSTLSVKCDTRTSVRVFTAWHEFVDVRVKHRCLADTFHRLQRYHKGVEALKAVRSQSHHRSLLLEKAKLFTVLLQGNQLSSIFARWKEFAKLARKTRAVTLQYLQGKLLPTYWRAWVAVVRRRRSLTVTARAVATTWTNISVRRAWNALAAYHANRLARRQQLIQGEMHFQSRQLRTAVRYWRASAEWERNFASVCRGAVVRWQMATACRCLMALRQFAANHRRIKASATSVAFRSRQKTTLTAWCAWRKLFLVLQAGRRRNLAYYWRKWRAWRSGKQSLALLQDRIRAVMLKSTQRHAFQSWSEYISRRKLVKAMALMSSQFSEALAVKRSFASWRTFVSLAQANKAQMRAVIAHMQSRLVHAAFRSLAAYREHRRRRRADTSRASAHYSQRVAARMLNAWRLTVSTRSAQRERLRIYVSMLQHAVQGKSFRSWAAYTAHRRDLRKKMARSLAMRTQLCLQTLFFEWRRFVTKAKRNQRAMAFHRVFSSRHTFKHWRQLVVLNKVERMMGTSAKRTLETCFVVWRKRVTTTRQVRGFHLEVQRKRQLGVLTCCFEAWREWSSVRSRCQRILSRMAAGSHLRFRFFLWKEFSAQRRRLALLLQPASVVINAKGMVLEDDGDQKQLDGDKDGMASVDSDDPVAVLRAQLALKARFFQQFEFSWDLHSVWRYWRLAFHAVLFHRLRTLQRLFLGWKHHAGRRKRARLVIAALTGSRQHSSVRNVFISWRNVVRRVKQLQAERQRERQLWTIVNTEMLRREKRQLRTHFAAWFSLLQDERHLQSSADAYHRARLITKVWLAWRHDFHELAALTRRRCREQQRQLRRHALSRAVRALHTHRARRKRVRLVVEYCLNKRNDELIPKIMSGWHKWTRCQRIGERHREYVEHERLRRLLRSWKAAVDQHQRYRLILSMLSEQRVEQVCTRVWGLWLRFVKRKRHSRLLTTRAVAFRVRWLLHSRWLDRARTSRCQHRQSDLVAQKLSEFRLRRAALTWRSSVRHRQLRQLYRRFVQRKFLSQWQTNAKLALAMRFHEWTRRLMARRILVQWRSAARRLGHWRRLTVSFSSARQSSTLRQVWWKWLAFVGTRRLAHLAAEFNARRLKSRCLCTWGNAVQSLIDEREARLDAVVKRLEHGVRRRALTHWRALAQRKKQRRFVVLACVFKLDGFRQKRVLQTVVAAWRQHTRLAHACRCLAASRDERVARDVSRAWRVWVKARQAQREKAKEAQRYYTRRLVSATFFYWQNYALAWREVDSESSALPSAVARSGLSRLTVGEKISARTGECDDVDSEDSEQVEHRPMSPVIKRLGKKKDMLTSRSDGRPADKKTRANADLEDRLDDGNRVVASVTPSLGDAAELTVGVRKRLQVLGPWRQGRRASTHSEDC